MGSEKLFEIVVSTEKPADWDEKPIEVREIEEKAYMILGEYAWVLKEQEGKYLIEMRNLNALDKFLMFEVKTFKNDEDMVISVLSSDFDELETYKMMFLTERNREFFFDEFRDESSKWVYRV